MVRCLLLLSLLWLLPAVTHAAEEKAVEPSPELRAFARQLVKIMETQDRQALADLVDFEHILEQSSFSKCEFDTALSKAKFYLGLVRACRDIENPFYKKFLPENDLVSLMQIKKITDQESLILLRYFNGGISNFMAFRVTADENKTLKIIDVGNGCSISTFSRGIEIAVLPMHKYDYIKTMGPYEPLRDWLTKNNDVFAAFIQAYNADDDPATVVKLYPQLLPAIQEMPLIEYHYYRANALVDEAVLKLEDLRAYHAKHRDPGTLQLVLEYCRRQGDVDSVLAIYDEFDKLIGVDPLNNLHRANTLIEQEKYLQAYECARQLIKDYPELPRSHITLMVVSLFDKNHKLALTQLQHLRDKFQLDLTELIDTDDDYKDFRSSPEYAVWKKENATAAGQNKKQ